MLVGRSLLALGIISVALLIMIFTYPISVQDTKLAALLRQLEMFAPLLGIVVFSDLIASDIEARRATLLMSSRCGLGPVLLRKLVHGLLITSAVQGGILLVLRVSYTSFDPLSAFLIVLPGALYYGMIGLLGATVASNALVGYAVGTGGLVLSMVMKQVMPLSPNAFQLKSQLANGTLFDGYNWLFAKIAFVVLAGVLAGLVLAMVRNRTSRLRIVLSAALLLIGGHAATHVLWSREVPMDQYFPVAGKQLDVIQREDELVVRSVAVQVWGRGRDKSNEEALVTDTIYAREEGRWVQRQSVEYDPTAEYDLRHVDIDAEVDPEKSGIEATATADLLVLAPSLRKVYLRLAWEFSVTRVSIEGQQVPFLRHGDLVEVPLGEPASKGQTIPLAIAYGGNLRLPSMRQGLERCDKNTLFVNSRWYPFTKGWYHQGPKDLCTFEARITAPQGWQVGAADSMTSSGANPVWRFGSRTPGERIGLLVTRLPKYETKAGDITVTVFGHSMGRAYMAQIAERACDALRRFEEAFGPYPHRNLAIVEYDHMNAGGVAVPSVVLMNTDRCRSEHKREMLDMYVPHEVSHQWYSGALPLWVAEASAVYSNYLYLRHAADNEGALAEFHRGLDQFFEYVKDRSEPLMGDSLLMSYTRGGYLPIMLTSLSEQRVVDSLASFIQGQAKEQIVNEQATAERFVEAMARAAGNDWAPFVSAWVHRVDRFDPAVTEVTQAKGGDGFRIRASLAHREPIRFPVPVRILFEDGTQREATWVGSNSSETMEWTFDRPARSITLDPHHVLLDWNRSNNSCQVSTQVADKKEPVVPPLPEKTEALGWTTYTVADGLLGNNVRCLAVDSTGRLVAGFDLFSRNSGTLVQCFREKWIQPDVRSEASGPIHAVAVLPQGTIWTGAFGHLRRINETGTNAFVTSQMRHYRSFAIGKGVFESNPAANSDIAGYAIYDLEADTAGNIWIATDNGLSVVDGDAHVMRHFTTEDGLPSNEALCLAWQGQDVLWVGTGKGCGAYRNGKWESHPELTRGIVMSIAADTKGNVYLGTYREGVLIYNGQGLRRLDTYNSHLPHNMVTALLCDGQNRLWVGTGEGLLCVEESSQHLYTKQNSGLLSNHITALA
ncbi:MAG: two-component regulator propeller domain-containing protein, partial [Solirubrobacterales bacterium]